MAFFFLPPAPFFPALTLVVTLCPVLVFFFVDFTFALTVSPPLSTVAEPSAGCAGSSAGSTCW